MFVKFQAEITPYSAVFEILLTYQIFFCLFWREMLRNGTTAYIRVNRSQNWYDNGPDPCEQSTFPFQKSDQCDNGTISFPCERSLNFLAKVVIVLCDLSLIKKFFSYVVNCNIMTSDGKLL